MGLRTPFLGFLGLVVLGLVAAQLVQGEITVTAAATRVGIVAAVLVGVERFVLPLARTLITTGHRGGL